MLPNPGKDITQVISSKKYLMNRTFQIRSKDVIFQVGKSEMAYANFGIFQICQKPDFNICRHKHSQKFRYCIEQLQSHIIELDKWINVFTSHSYLNKIR